MGVSTRTGGIVSGRLAGFGKWTLAITVAAAPLLACGAAEEGDLGDEDLGSTSEAITRTLANPVSWSQGEAAKKLGSSADRACFLTQVKGAFEGGGEAVFVRVGTDGQWELGGQSQQSGVGASANCVRNVSVEVERTWAQGQAPRELGAAAGRVCFLTRVSGKFEGGGEVLRTRVGTNSLGQQVWFLDGASQQVGVNGAARCVRTSNFSNEMSWSQGAVSTALTSLATQPDDFSGPACFLTRVKGAFEGGGESVLVNRVDFGVNEVPRVRKIQWFLGGSSQQSGVGASARCLF